MTRVDQLRARMRSLELRVAALEARRPSRKREAAPRPTDAVIAGRIGLWDRFVLLQVGRGPTAKLAFAVRHRLNPTELYRFFSANDRRGIPEGSGPALRFYQALRNAIAELEARGRVTHGQHSDGKMTGSQVSGARLH